MLQQARTCIRAPHYWWDHAPQKAAWHRHAARRARQQIAAKAQLLSGSNGSDSSSSSGGSNQAPLITSCAVKRTDAPTVPVSQPIAQSASAAGLELQPHNTDRTDLTKAVAVGTAISVLAGILDHDAVEAHQKLAMAAVFVLGYAGIIVEDILFFSKSAVALLTACSLWIIRATGNDPALDNELINALSEVSSITIFIMGAMTIVEIIDQYQGFSVLTRTIHTRSPRALLFGISVLSFFMSAVLDNLTTTVVMLSLLEKLWPGDAETRRLMGAAVVVSANAGGAWTPIGDVTTTMLWIHGQITPLATMRDLVLPSIACAAVPAALMATLLPEFSSSSSSPAAPAALAAADGDSGRSNSSNNSSSSSSSSSMVSDVPSDAFKSSSSDSSMPQRGPSSLPSPHQQGTSAADGGLASTSSSSELQLQDPASNRGTLVLAVGTGALLAVPVFRHITGLPPYMGMLCGLGILWLLTDALSFGEEEAPLPRAKDALKNIDIEGVFFFTGILLAVGALDVAGVLTDLAQALGTAVPDPAAIAAALGLASALVDNVPLVAASMGMYDLAQAPADSTLWQLMALCAGTGGSVLVIGSAAGVAFMGLESGITFGWYLRRVTPWAAAGYFAGIGTYAALHAGVPLIAPVLASLHMV